ncbi:MAG: rod shape-determining protein MreC [Flavisolibacter sp.]
MRNIFFFIRRHITFLSFVVLQIIALLILFKYNRIHHAIGLGVASELTGSINTQVDKIDDYVHQGRENKRLHRVNDSLLNLLPSNFLYPDTIEKSVVDTALIDTVKAIRRYVARDAKVVYNSVNNEQNYLQIDRGAKYGIRDDMAVISSDLGVVGIVVAVSPNFSQVMSLLHVQMSVSAALKTTGNTGKVEWDGKDPRFVSFKGIPQNVEVKRGDTVLTSQYSFNFPPGYIIGTVDKAENDPATGFYNIRLKTAVNFSRIQQVFVVENLLKEEQQQLNAETQRKMEQKQRN